MIQKMVFFNKTETSQNVTAIIFFTKWLNVKFRHGKNGCHRWKPEEDSGFMGLELI